MKKISFLFLTTFIICINSKAWANEEYVDTVQAVVAQAYLHYIFVDQLCSSYIDISELEKSTSETVNFITELEWKYIDDNETFKDEAWDIALINIERNEIFKSIKEAVPTKSKSEAVDICQGILKDFVKHSEKLAIEFASVSISLPKPKRKF